MTLRVMTLALLAACIGAAQERPLSLCRNGGFERTGMWRVYQGTVVDSGRPGRCLRFHDQGSASQDVLAKPGATFTAAVDLRSDEVKPVPGKRGYGYAAVYQTDAVGNLVQFRDFVQPTGTSDWQRHSYTFTVHPRANIVSLRCGIFQATGVVCVDNWTLVQGKTARRMDEVMESGRRARAGAGAVAILDEPTMPKAGAPAQPAAIAKTLAAVGIKTELLSAADLADPAVLTPNRFDLVVVPTGRSFPAEARLCFVNFLRTGGDFISIGGYAFSDLLTRHKDTWLKEEAALKARLDLAMSQERSLLPNGGFEAPQAMPLGGASSDAQWHRTGERCTIVAESPREGKHCAKVVVPPGASRGETKFWLDLPAEPQAIYKVTGCLKTQGVSGKGFAYIALYQYAKDDKLVKHKDFVTCRGTTDWSAHSYTFAPEPGVTRIHIKFGLYLAEGTAWFDDIRLGNITGLSPSPMNTATGTPKDGLVTTPAQIGIFDASFPLKRAQSLRAAPGQYIVPPGLGLQGPLQGWAAAGVRGYDNARWVPLLQTYDRYGRPRGAAAAVMLNYNGFYAGSSWAYFGIENIDLFANGTGPMAEALQNVARFVLRETYLHDLTTDQRLYRDLEPVRISVVVSNRGVRAQKAKVRLSVTESPLQAGRTARLLHEEAIVADTESDATVRTTFQPGQFASDLYRVTAVLMIDDKPVDEMTAGFVVDRASVMQSAADSRFADNYFTRGDRPVFLFGSDTYSYTYRSAHESPLTWAQDHHAARDVGLNVYENLQYNGPKHQLADSDWRAFRAMAQLTQKHNLVFMPGMLIGHDVGIGLDAVAEQSAHCAAYAQHLSDTPALHYYINGDYQNHIWKKDNKARAAKLWNDWLEQRYGTTAKLKLAWGQKAATAELGSLPYPPVNSGLWDDRAAIDKELFLLSLTRRWNESHVAAIRPHDPKHPIMSEYYSRPFDGLDLRITIDAQDVSDVGYFDRPVDDIDKLPLKIRWNDLRARGKGVSLGEYGVKTHPAWTVENGARGYHIVRTEEQQKQLFLTVAHYALGLGASKIQNWCLRDAQARVFPWGIFYPNQLIPKDVAYVHRNESMVWRHFSPRYVAPALTVCIANHLRIGNQPTLGTDVAYRAFADLLALHYDFNVVDDFHLDTLPAATKAMIYPSPFAIRDDAYAKLLAWVRAGGKLFVTGDISCDPDRRPTRRTRLRELLGVEFVKASYPDIERGHGQDADVSFSMKGLTSMRLRPCVQTRVGPAQALGKTAAGVPALVRHTLGSGEVYWCADPVELASEPEACELRRPLYAAFLGAAGIHPLQVKPNAPWLHVMAQPTATGTVHVVYNTKLDEGDEAITVQTEAGDVALRTRNRWPALAAVAGDGRVVAVNAYGTAAAQGQPIMAGRGLKALLSLDGLDLRESKAVLVGPFDEGRLELPPRKTRLTALFGEFRGGQWATLETAELAGGLSLDIDADRATCMILLCEPNRAAHWTAALSLAMTRPERIKGY